MMKLGLVQMDCRIGDKTYNVNKALDFIGQAGKQQVNMIVFPEMFSTGYNTEILGKRYQELAEDPDGPTYKTLSEAAVRNRLYIVAPMVLKSPVPGVLYNGLIFIDPRGRLLGTYNKTHLWAGERYYFRAGFEYPVFDTDFGKVGCMICYDGGFPEVSRILARNGAELILCPSAFPIWDKDMWDIYFMTRSLENACFVAGINRVGREDALDMFGNNKIYAPRARLVAEAPVNVETMLTADIDMEQTAICRAGEVPYLRDLQPRSYRRLVEDF
jgi:predicted amidohydrolase